MEGRKHHRKWLAARNRSRNELERGYGADAKLGGAGAASAVPETPTALLTAGTVAVVAWAWRRKKRAIK